MPTAICNTCNELVHYRKGFLKNQVCECGSKDLTAVSGRLNENATGWNYYDRKQTFVKHVPFTTNVPRDTNITV